MVVFIIGFRIKNHGSSWLGVVSVVWGSSEFPKPLWAGNAVPQPRVLGCSDVHRLRGYGGVDYGGVGMVLAEGLGGLAIG